MLPVQAQNLWGVIQEWRLDALQFLHRDVPKIIFVLLVAFILVRLMRAVTRRLIAFSREQLESSRAQQLRTLASVINGVWLSVISFVALMQILPVLGINMGPLLASAGIAGLAIGFGAQTLVKDVINGFFILLENQYDVGDVVRLAGVTGTVESLTLRRTVLRDGDGALHNVPNSEIKVVSNLTRDWTLTALHVAVDYRENSDRIIGLLKEVSAQMRHDAVYGDSLVAEPEVPGIERVAGNEVDYLVLVKTKPGRQFAVTRELRRRIKDCFEKHNVQPGGPARMYTVEPTPGK